MSDEKKQEIEETLALVKPDAVSTNKTEHILARIEKEGFRITQYKYFVLSKERAELFYEEHKGKPFFEELVAFMTSGPIYALRLSKDNAIKDWRTLMGPTKPDVAKNDAPNSIRALYGVSTTKNASHGSDSPQSAKRELDLIFNVQYTLALIKPDAFKAQKQDEIIQHIKKHGFKVVEIEQVQLTQDRAKAFYIEHHSKRFYNELVTYMSSGPIIALKLEHVNAIIEWRTLMGPTNPADAKKNAPNSIRAMYGTDITHNATHGSDSPQSAARELDFFFPNQNTLALIKPDVVHQGKAFEVIDRIQREGFKIIELDHLTLSKERAEAFYAEHKNRNFFPSLIEFMISGPIYALQLERYNAIKAWRALMGPTLYQDAKQNAPHSIRASYATSDTKNASHGSDSVESAQRELNFFFPEQNTLALIKPEAVKSNQADEIIHRIKMEGFHIIECEKITLTKEKAQLFYEEHKEKPFFGELVESMISGPIYALQLHSIFAIKKWRNVMGPTKPDVAKKESPYSIRALFGTSTTNNATHGSDGEQSAKRELNIIFPKEQTLALIKPDAVAFGFANNIISRIRYEGFTIVEQKQINLTKEKAELFYAEHKDRSFFNELVEFMISGPIIGLKLEKYNAIKAWRSLMGPTKPDTARNDAPQSIRALYGGNNTCNATHGSDSPQSSKRELEFFF